MRRLRPVRGELTEYGHDAGLIAYVRILRRGLWIVALTVALTTAAAVYFSVREQKLYRSSADVFLSTQNIAASLSNIQLPTPDPTRVAATQAALAETPAVAARALALAHVHGRTAEQFLSRSSVSPASDADILTFAVTDSSPRLAQRLAQAYATAYTRYRRQLDTSSIAQALNQVQSKLAQLRAAGARRSNGYANLVDKEEQLTTLQLLQGSNAQLVRSAGPATQIQPRPRRDGALGAALGLIIGIGLALLRDVFNTRVRTAAEVQESLDLPLLARIPDPGRRLRAKNELVMLSKPGSPAAEAYRILATNLDFVNLERSARTIMFTSAERGEGKSTTAANLAVALARTGRRIILVDLDLRAPSLSGFFYLDDRGGLTDVTLGRLRLGNALAPVPLVEPAGDHDHGSRNGSVKGVLEVLPVGTRPPNPAEFIGSDTLADLLAQLEEQAELVLVDAPPLLHLSDAMTLTGRVDALVLVAKLATLRRPVLHELHRVLQNAPVSKLGVVLTGTDEGEAYGGGYGYSYGHGEAHEPAPARREQGAAT